jgi:hypothetical protein
MAPRRSTLVESRLGVSVRLDQPSVADIKKWLEQQRGDDLGLWQRSGWARPVLLLNADAMKSSGLELEPLETVASFTGPRIWGIGVPGGVD